MSAPTCCKRPRNWPKRRSSAKDLPAPIHPDARGRKVGQHKTRVLDGEVLSGRNGRRPSVGELNERRAGREVRERARNQRVAPRDRLIEQRQTRHHPGQTFACMSDEAALQIVSIALNDAQLWKPLSYQL